ncbi:hypothetical protein C8Q79DRAFT_46790 [Trametes meyenii]|nr:hypothetical protein C8Q79DRAFT_46790 [Trametes meyenii]
MPSKASFIVTCAPLQGRQLTFQSNTPASIPLTACPSDSTRRDGSNARLGRRRGRPQAHTAMGHRNPRPGSEDAQKRPLRRRMADWRGGHHMPAYVVRTRRRALRFATGGVVRGEARDLSPRGQSGRAPCATDATSPSSVLLGLRTTSVQRPASLRARTHVPAPRRVVFRISGCCR